MHLNKLSTAALMRLSLLAALKLLLGRFLGYTGLMTLVLVVMTVISLLYLLREIDPEAKRESVHARVPLYGDVLVFPGTKEGNANLRFRFGH